MRTKSCRVTLAVGLIPAAMVFAAYLVFGTSPPQLQSALILVAIAASFVPMLVEIEWQKRASRVVAIAFYGASLLVMFGLTKFS